jgi:Tol biopolymer transport system component
MSSLVIYNVTLNQTTTVISRTEQIPGVVAWSPKGDVIAYAAAPAEFANQYEGGLILANPGIAGRRIYLLDPETGQTRRLNEIETFQDAPTWSEDGATLYYVQKEDETTALMGTELDKGQTEILARQNAPEVVGYYGVEGWDDLLAQRPD